MTENKRFELTINERGQADIIDWFESKEKNAICIYNDLGVLPYTSAKAVCKKLNEQDERIETLKEDVEIILDYVLNKGKFAMTVKEQKAHNRLRGFVRGDVDD